MLQCLLLGVRITLHFGQRQDESNLSTNVKNYSFGCFVIYPGSVNVANTQNNVDPKNNVKMKMTHARESETGNVNKTRTTIENDIKPTN